MAKALGGEIVVYEGSGGEVRVDVRLEHETVWLYWCRANPRSLRQRRTA